MKKIDIKSTLLFCYYLSIFISSSGLYLIRASKNDIETNLYHLFTLTLFDKYSLMLIHNYVRQPKRSLEQSMFRREEY